MKPLRYVVAGLAVIVAVLGVVGLAARSTTLTALAKERGWSFLLYAHLSNRILLVERGAVRSVDTEVPGKFLDHHAHPSIAPDGRVVAFVRPSTAQGMEDLVLYDVTKRAESLLQSWPGRIWSVAWAPTRPYLAFVADKTPSPRRNTSLYIIDTASHEVNELTPGLEWVATYSSPSWSPTGDRIAFERYHRTPEGEFQTVLTVDIGTQAVTTVADGWFPSWSPDGNKMAYITPHGSRCYEVDLRDQRRRLIWGPFPMVLLDRMIAGPAVWSPAGQAVFLNYEAGMDGDSRDVYCVDLASGRASRMSYDPAFEVVGWLGHERKRQQPR